LNTFKNKTAKKIFGKTKAEALETFTCIWCHCGSTIDTFRDEESRKEYTISGMCQDCQDKIFEEAGCD
jgi:hypothetical protein